MRNVPTRATITAIALAGAATPAAASSLQMIYQATEFASHIDLLAPIPGAFGQVISGTNTGGDGGAGEIFVLVPGKQGSWTKTVLHNFSEETAPMDGATPDQNMVADKAGNIWGTTSQGGANSTGTVFELVKPPTKKASWTYKSVTSLPVFVESPRGSTGLVFDHQGNLFGVSDIGCSPNYCGSIFEVSQATLNGGGGAPVVLLNLPVALGQPSEGLTIDAAGKLYGTSSSGNGYPYGAVWQVSPGKKGQPYSFAAIHSFCSIIDTYGKCVDGFTPLGSVTFSKGALYGTTGSGGGAYVVTDPNTGFQYGDAGNGITFEMTPPGQTGGAWGFTVLHTLWDLIAWNTPGPDYMVHNPQSPPVLSSSGSVISQNSLGGTYGNAEYPIYGSVISVDPSGGGDAIVSNDFAVEANNTRGGPVASVNNPVPIHLDAKNRVYGIGLNTYDTNCVCTQYWENIYMITP